MSEEHIPTPGSDDGANTSGYSGSGYRPEDEGPELETGTDQAAEETPARTGRERPEPKRKSDEWKRNFNATFGQGIGRISLFASVVVVLILISVGVRQLTSSAERQANDNEAQVEAPNAPEAPIAVKPISPQEAARRNDVSAQEAEQAKESGESYQPAFMPNIGTNDTEFPERTDIFSKSPHLTPPQNMPIDNSAENERRLLEEARQRQEQALAEARRTRDEFVTKKQALVMDQLNKMLLDDALNKLGSYSVSTYATPVVAETAEGSTSGRAGQGGAGLDQQRRTPIIRTGNVLYAETSSEINTDDGNDAMAVIRGGAWDGSKLIGKIENRPNNIGVRFTTLAPQDGRPAMTINAIALRTEDASQGIAKDIDHHTLERYAALGFSSLLSGYGKAYSQPTGTSVIAPSGTAITTTQEPSTKQVVATTLGELGTNASQEIARGFDRPTTYRTPAGHGLAIYFLSDVYAEN